MPTLGLEDHIVDGDVYDRTVRSFAEAKVLLPTFAELAEPKKIPYGIRRALEAVKPDEAHPLNLFRVHWYNATDRSSQSDVPAHVVLGKELTGVDATIVVALGDRFPMIRAHKVLAAYGCLAPRIVTGQFDPSSHRAVWPSTGNYCRGGVAISRLMGCRGVAVLPEGMSRERFAWLEDWVADPADVIRTPGSESNVKEIYDRCAELSADPLNVVFNQFSEFGNHLVHYECTGAALGDIFEQMQRSDPGLRLRAFVSASGSAGTLGAGDHLKDAYGTRIVAVEALECPTMLYNGFGEHNIQGIGDKHIPLIHNVYNTDLVAAVSDRATDHLAVLFSSPEGLAYLADRRHVGQETLSALGSFGPVQHLQHPCRGKDRQVPGPRSERRHRDGRHRRGGDVRQRAGQDHGPGLPRRFRRGGRGRGFRALDVGRRDRPPPRHHGNRPRADIQPWLLHVGRTTGPVD